VTKKTNFIKLKPRSYCKVSNPVVRDRDGKVVVDKFEGIEETEQQQVKNSLGKNEIRTYEDFPEPFPLYPGEEMFGKILQYQTVAQDSALVIKVIQPHTSADGEKRIVGD